jgi:hypothetical protein
MDYLHLAFASDPVLLPGLELRDSASFFIAAVIAVVVCVSERFLTLAQDRRWTPSVSIRRSKFQTAVWRAGVYWWATFLRLMYMIIAMSCHLGLIFIIATTLALTQLFIDLYRSSSGGDADEREHMQMHYSLVNAAPGSYDLPSSTSTTMPISRSMNGTGSSITRDHRSSASTSTSTSTSTVTSTTRPRSKSKPDHIFIHPAQSNLARADAMAQQLGLSGETEMVKVVGLGLELGQDDQDTRTNGNAGMAKEWREGKGRGVARALMGKKGSEETGGFVVGEEEEDDEETDRTALLGR